MEDFKVELVEIAQISKTKFTGSERIFFNFFARILCDRFCVRGDTRTSVMLASAHMVVTRLGEPSWQ